MGPCRKRCYKGAASRHSDSCRIVFIGESPGGISPRWSHANQTSVRTLPSLPLVMTPVISNDLLDIGLVASKSDETSQPVCSIACSPNGCCVALLHADSELIVHSLGTLPLPQTTSIGRFAPGIVVPLCSHLQNRF